LCWFSVVVAVHVGLTTAGVNVAADCHDTAPYSMSSAFVVVGVLPDDGVVEPVPFVALAD
jgi:hypothetical protein